MTSSSRAAPLSLVTPLSAQPPGIALHDDESPFVWVECLGPRGQVLQRQRFDRLPLRVGPGYRNHFIVDGCSAPDRAHLLFTRSSRGTLRVQVVDGPPAMLGGEPVGREPTTLVGGAALRWGGASLRVIEGDLFGDAAARPRRAEQAGTAEPGVAVTLGLALAGLVLTGFANWLQEFRPQPWWQHALNQANALGVLFLWPLLWALACKAVSGRSHWRGHARLAAWGVLALGTGGLAYPLAAAALGWAPAASWSSSAVAVLGGVLAVAHLQHFGGSVSSRRKAAATVASLALAAMLLNLAPDWLDDAAAPRTAGFNPPGWTVRPTQGMERVMARLQAAETEVAAARLAPLPRDSR